MVINTEHLVHHSIFNQTDPIVLTRCPGRISLSKHADYINSDLLYTLDDRAIYIAAQKAVSKSDSGQISLINLNNVFENIVISQSQINLITKDSWGFYILRILEELKLLHSDFDLNIVVDGDLPDASGLSSSHALMVATILALKDLFKLKITNLETIKLCKTIDNLKGFKSGLGDQSAQLLCKADHFNFIKLFPNIQNFSIPIDPTIGLMTVPSFIKATKSNPEFKAANENIAIYQQINELTKSTLAKLLGADIEINYLADLLLFFDDKAILQAINSISDKKIRGVALYGLAEAARLKDLKENFSINKLATHLQLSHQAEKNYELVGNKWTRIPESQQLNYTFDINLPLTKHSGIYLASTLANDQLQHLSTKIDGVLGSSISGAGLGGNNIILCKRNQAEQIKATLIKEYYQPMGLEKEAREGVHLIQFSQAAGSYFS